MHHRLVRLGIILAVVGIVLVSLVPVTAVGQTDAVGTVVIAEGETVSGINTVAGTVVLRGTVAGDVRVVAGNVQIAESGTVQGDLRGAAGNIQIDGTVEGDVSAGAGNINIGETGVIGGTLEAGAGNVLIAGTIEGDASVSAETIRLGETAVIAGSLTYDGTLEGNQEAVQGSITRDPARGDRGIDEIEPLMSVVFSAYAFLVNFIIGALLLYVFPAFSMDLATRITREPVRTGLIGLGILIGVPFVLIALAITIIGIPLSIIGTFAFLVSAWIGIVYGRFAVGVWLLRSFTDSENKWIALIVGLLVGVILTVIPVVGGFVNFVIFLLGLGAVSHGIYAHWQNV